MQQTPCTQGAVHTCINHFTKAIARQTRDVSFGVLRSRVEACQYLGAALEAEGADSLAGCNTAVLDHAVELAASRLGEDKARNVASQIGLIAGFLHDNMMTSAPLADWSPCKAGSGKPVDASAAEARARERLPADGYVAALGKAFQVATLDADMIITSLLALVFCLFGGRIDDVLNLAFDCDAGLDDGNALALRIVGSKSSGAVVVDVPHLLSGLGRLALSRIRRVSSPAHATKKWYDEHPDKLYLPKELEHLRGKPWLEMTEAARLIGLSGPIALQYARRHGMDLTPARGPGGGRSSAVGFASLERHYLGQLPSRMRAAGGPDYHPLLIVPQGLFKRARSQTGSACMFEVVTHEHVRSALMPRDGAPGMFKRLGVDEGRGNGDRTNPVRHFLATLAGARGVLPDDLSQLQLRTDARHNASYVHFADEAAAALLARVAANLPSPGSERGAAGSHRSASPEGTGSNAIAMRLLRSQGLLREPRAGGGADRDAT